MLNRGAQIVDVRSEREFQSGHIEGAVNVPLDGLSKNLAKIQKSKPVITCCASGVRSGMARRILKSNGFIEVVNGGAWVKLKGKLQA